MSTELAFLAGCVMLYVVVAAVFRHPRMRSLNARLKCERNRNRFGKLRTELVHLAIEGKIDPRSRLFASVYRALTILMRYPYEFEKAASILLHLPVPKSSNAERPTHVEGQMAREFSLQLDLLCRDYSRVYWIAASLMDLLFRSKKGVPPLWIQMVIQRRAKKPTRAMVAVRRRLDRTAALAAPEGQTGNYNFAVA